MKTTNAATEQFNSVTMKLVSYEDVYGGKICAALERKHPRDLFDVMVLYENEGISDQLFRVLLVYVASSNRAIHESLSPTQPVREDLYDDRFRGMSLRKTSLKALTETGLRLHEDIRSRFTDEVETFLISLHNVEPDFGLIGFPDAVNLPAVRWKLLNLGRLKKSNPKNMHNSGRQSGGCFNKTGLCNAPDGINAYPSGQNHGLLALPDEFSDGTTLVETKCIIS